MKNFTASAIMLVLFYFATIANAFACFCGGQFTGFWDVVSPATKNAMVRFEEVVQGEESSRLYGKFVVLENYNTTDFKVNNAITLSAMDNICGFEMQRLSAGDTLIVALRSDHQIDGSCTHNYMRFAEGYANGLSLQEVKARILTLTNSPEDLLASNNLIVYPNPATSFLSVKFLNFGKLPNKIEILDMSGRVLKTKEISGVDENLEIQSLPKGLYILKLSYNGLGPIMRRWVKA